MPKDEEKRTYYDWFVNKNDYDKKRSFELKELMARMPIGELVHDGLSDTTPTLNIIPRYNVVTKDSGATVSTASVGLYETTDIAPGNWLVHEVTGGLLADANVADRALTVSIHKDGVAISSVPPPAVWTSQAVSVQATELGIIWMNANHSGYYHVYDDGTISKSTLVDNPVPFYLSKGAYDGVSVDYTNKAAGDLSNIRIVAERVF